MPSVRGTGAARTAPRVDARRHPVLPQTGRPLLLISNMTLWYMFMAYLVSLRRIVESVCS